MLDFVNILYILTILIIVNKYCKIDNVCFIILIFHLFSVFIFNGFLFSSGYMPDQIEYLELAKSFRNFNMNLSFRT